VLQESEILNASILIVDDQAPNVLLLEQILQNAGYLHVTSTMEPQAVADLHAANHYDLVLLDLQMPNMDGFDVMEAMKALATDDYLSVLVVTAQPSHKLRALQAGAKDFVSKPFDLVEVQTRIRNMLEVRLLYKKLGNYNALLEKTVLERTAELRESEARFKSFTSLASDWYWEQDAQGNFTECSGPVTELLGIGTDSTLKANIAARRPFIDLICTRTNVDGSLQYLQVSGEPIFDNTSKFSGYRGIGMNITERVARNL
jgi:CheY-like chemotaxis protein